MILFYSSKPEFDKVCNENINQIDGFAEIKWPYLKYKYHKLDREVCFVVYYKWWYGLNPKGNAIKIFCMYACNFVEPTSEKNEILIIIVPLPKMTILKGVLSKSLHKCMICGNFLREDAILNQIKYYQRILCVSECSCF